MSQAGYTPISLYYSTTASATPIAGNLTNGELAINIQDEKLYFKNAAGTVKLLASNASSTGTVSSVAQSFTGGLISVAGSPITTSGTLALTVAGTSGGLVYFSSASTWASSAVLAANALMIGGGAGAAPATTTTGTGVVTAIGNNVNTANGFVTQTATLTASALLLGGGSGTGISSATTGTGVVTALGVNVGTAGAFVVNGGALGTPSSGTVTNLTGTASININGTVGATTPAAGTFTSLSDSGNLTFTGTGNRITGDFSNATVANRVAFQSSTTNGNTNLEVLTNGTSVQSGISFANSSDLANNSLGQVLINSTDFRFNSNLRGTGTYLPMTFYTGGSERMRIATDGKVGIGTASAAVSFAISSTDAILIPKGTTAQQPTGVAGYLRFNTTTSTFEGYNGTAWSAVGGGAAVSNDTSTATNVYPLFANATTGTPTTIYTSNAKLLYKPSTGELTALAMISSNGINVNSQTVSASYTIASGNNGLSAGTVNVATGITVTVATGSVWTVV